MERNHQKNSVLVLISIPGEDLNKTWRRVTTYSEVNKIPAVALYYSNLFLYTQTVLLMTLTDVHARHYFAKNITPSSTSLINSSTSLGNRRELSCKCIRNRLRKSM